MSSTLRTSSFFCCLALAAAPTAFAADASSAFAPATQKVLENPAAEDWLMFSRTYDGQRFSPLEQVNRKTVKDLAIAWDQELPAGQMYGIPLAYRGMLYVLAPGDVLIAYDGATGKQVWRYDHEETAAQKQSTRAKTIAMYEDMIYLATGDNHIAAVDMQTGKLRWNTEVTGGGAQTSGVIAVKGMVVSGRACAQTRDSCFTAAHDAKTGKELWRFYHVPAKGEPGSETWGDSPNHDKNMASTWGLPGSYDPKRNLILWGVANPMPNTRMDRHGGNSAGTGFTAPADLYSNSTVALEPETGKLKWYYQHLPADDWDEDYTNDRTLVHTKINPDPKKVKWINEEARGKEFDVSVMIGEGGGVFVIDRDSGRFLWAHPYPFESDRFLISDIDTKTGKTTINRKVVLEKPGDERIICYWNTRSFWPTAYSPRTNSVYATYIDNCLDMTAKSDQAREKRFGVFRPEGDPQKISGLAKINLETGEIMHFNQSRVPTTGSMLTTAGGIVFNGDLGSHFRAFNDETGELLWDTKVGGPISVSTITYAAGGKQYVAIQTGDTMASGSLTRQSGTEAPRGFNHLYVFALPKK